MCEGEPDDIPTLDEIWRMAPSRDSADEVIGGFTYLRGETVAYDVVPAVRINYPVRHPSFQKYIQKKRPLGKKAPHLEKLPPRHQAWNRYHRREGKPSDMPGRLWAKARRT
jgi:hypothetical protein